MIVGLLSKIASIYYFKTNFSSLVKAHIETFNHIDNYYIGTLDFATFCLVRKWDFIRSENTFKNAINNLIFKLKHKFK